MLPLGRWRVSPFARHAATAANIAFIRFVDAGKAQTPRLGHGSRQLRLCGHGAARERQHRQRHGACGESQKLQPRSSGVKRQSFRAADRNRVGPFVFDRGDHCQRVVGMKPTIRGFTRSFGHASGVGRTTAITGNVASRSRARRKLGEAKAVEFAGSARLDQPGFTQAIHQAMQGGFVVA